LRLAREPDIGEQAVIEPRWRLALARTRATRCHQRVGLPAEAHHLIP
jgi:hypothetical protein